MADYAVWSPSHSGRGGDSVIWLAVHTAEGATTAVSLANYLANPTNEVSYHDVCDDSTTIQCVDYADEAWAMLGGNPRSDQVCCTGFAAWSTSTWLSHQGMLDRIARWLAQRARVRGIPLDHIGSTGVTDRVPGVIGHWDYTIGAHDGTHTDPGPNFPWDYVITKARQHNRTGDDLMSQGTWARCTKDSTGDIIAERGYLCAPVGKASSLVARGWFSLATGWDSGADRDIAFYDDSGTKVPAQGDGPGCCPSTDGNGRRSLMAPPRSRCSTALSTRSVGVSSSSLAEGCRPGPRDGGRPSRIEVPWWLISLER